MGIAKELDFDIFMTKSKAQTQKKIFELLAEESSSLCGVDAPALLNVFEKRLSERIFGMGDGIAIFDVTSSEISSPVLVIMTFEKNIDIASLDGKTINILVAVISPSSSIPFHLQRLASVSRVMRSRDLCNALRDVQDCDAMRVLFMPSQDWMIAA